MKINPLYWWIAWRPQVAFLMALVVGGLCWLASGSPLGLLVGVPFILLWRNGIAHVDANHDQLVKQYSEELKLQIRRRLGLESAPVRVFTLGTITGSPSLGMEVISGFSVRFIFVADGFLAVSEECFVDMVERRMFPPQNPGKEIYLRHIYDVCQHQSKLIMKLVTGETISIFSVDAAAVDAVVAQIRGQLRGLERLAQATSSPSFVVNNWVSPTPIPVAAPPPPYPQPAYYPPPGHYPQPGNYPPQYGYPQQVAPPFPGQNGVPQPYPQQYPQQHPQYEPQPTTVNPQPEAQPGQWPPSRYPR